MFAKPARLFCGFLAKKPQIFLNFFPSFPQFFPSFSPIFAPKMFAKKKEFKICEEPVKNLWITCG